MKTIYHYCVTIPLANGMRLRDGLLMVDKEPTDPSFYPAIQEKLAADFGIDKSNFAISSLSRLN
jgi:hypothetical protein